MTPKLLNFLWLVPVFPLAGAAINGFFGRQSSKKAITAVALGFCGLSFFLALLFAFNFSSTSAPYSLHLAHWLRSGSFAVDFDFYLDQLSLVMLLVVTGVGFLIHIYSVGYMWDDDGYYRFMAYMNLFMFFMLTLVLAKNYLMMFIGWEGVGLASYLLIGFWFIKDSAASAGKKAFIVNRIGDFGFLIALFLMIKHFGTLDFPTLFAKIQPLGVESAGAGLLTAIGLLLMVGAAGQVRADSALRLAARRHGRPDACLRVDSRGDHGDGGRLYGGALPRDFRARAGGLDGRRHHRNAHRALCRDHWHRADRHQESSRILHRFTARLHVHGLRRGSVFGRHLSPDDACVFQRAAVSGGRVGDSWHWRRAGHAQDGRPAAATCPGRS